MGLLYNDYLLQVHNKEKLVNKEKVLFVESGGFCG